jgi:hypothetical protein
MNKKSLVLGLILLLGISSIGFGAQLTFQQVSQASQEMRKSVEWLTEGLFDLRKDQKLALTAAQKKKILPIFQSLIQNKIVQISIDNNNNNNHNHNNNVSSQSGVPNVNDPQVQARMKRMQDATIFGNAQTDAIDAILTKEQTTFIDNIDFNADKYGFIDFNKLFGGGGGHQGQRPDQATMDAMRKKMQAGRELLVKLNNQVLDMLSH